MLNINIDEKDVLEVQEAWLKLQGIKELLENNINLALNSILIKEYEEKYTDYNIKWMSLLNKYNATKYESEGKKVMLDFNKKLLTVE